MGKIIESIKKATNGTYEPLSSYTTLIGWIPKFDDKGRPINADPNYKDYTIVINDKQYYVTKKGWLIVVWKEPYKYTMLFNDNWKDYVIEWEDFTPDYIK